VSNVASDSGFGEVNALVGHDYANTILRAVAASLSPRAPDQAFRYPENVTRNTRVVFRYGGDEFIILAFNTSVSGGTDQITGRQVFHGLKMAELLQKIEKQGLAWGIVTNKSSRFTHRIVAALKVEPDCVVCGDSTPHLKPHPAPLELAARNLGLPPASCIYVGDDLRDVQAARAAGMRPVAAAWGYISPDNEGPRSWNAARDPG